MSLLDIFVIFTYYENAQKHKKRDNKITKQTYDNSQVKQKIEEIKVFHSSALHWNLKEIEVSLPNLIQKVKSTYRQIENRLGVEFHSEKGIDNFASQFKKGVKNFMDFSRGKAMEAQSRETLTIQPKEALSTLTKASITIENYLGGEYYFVTDEIKFEENQLFLIEGKHSRHAYLPSNGDIKDGLLKMILYTNLQSVTVNNFPVHSIPVLKLTSTKIQGKIASTDSGSEIKNFILSQKFSKKQIETINKLFSEAKINNFLVQIESAE